MGKDGEQAQAQIDAPSLAPPPVVGDDAAGGGQAALAPRDLPQGWETARSKNTGKVYYINIWSRESQYEFPAMPALPAGWSMALSTSTGEPYYVNSVTGDTQFEFPSGPVDGVEEPVAPPTAPSSNDTTNVDLPAGWDIATSRANNTKFYVNMVTGESQSEFPSAPALPDGWDMASSQQTGRTYYVNNETGEISFDLALLQDRLAEEQYLKQFEEEEKSAVKIQAHFRGHNTRNLMMQEITEEMEAEQREKRRRKQRLAFLESTESVPPPMMSNPKRAPPSRPVPTRGNGSPGGAPATPSRRPPSKPSRPAPSPGGTVPKRPPPRKGANGSPRRPPPRAPPKKPPPRAPPRAPPKRAPPASPGGKGTPSRAPPSKPAPRKAPPSRPSPAKKPSRAPPTVGAPEVIAAPTVAVPARRPPAPR